MNSIVVFCGAGEGTLPIFKEQAFALGTLLAQKQIRLVYGGAKIGLMGAVAEGVLQNGGQVTGVIPSFLLTVEVAHPQLSELIEVPSMHERKRIMQEKSDAIITLPGGFGTLEELFEMLTWSQLGLHQKPIGILNTNGFYDSLLLQIQQMQTYGFLKKENADLIIIETNLEALLKKMRTYKKPSTELHITSQQT
ncbi:MAG: TIGR00730 family Rossman fold protein [Bacteroidota bacterium]|jgi:uncharacterized protein (TIGR00730 family)